MISYIWPITLVVLSNIVYHICAKNLPENISPFSSLTVTYLIGALCAAVLFFVTEKTPHLFREIGKMNWAPYVLGVVIVGLEAGFVYAYKNGWQVSTASIVQSTFLSLALIVVGYALYHEPLTWNKLVGIGICLIGLLFINGK